MHYCLWAALLSACVAQAAAPLSEYAERRAALQKKLRGVIVLVGHTEKQGADSRDGFRQEPNFYYLTGWNEPGAALLLAPGEEILFLPTRDPEVEKWSGRQLASGDAEAKARTGFALVLSRESLETNIRRALEKHSKLYTLLKAPAAERLQQLAPLREISDAAPAIARLRMVKSETEIELIRRATEVTIAAQRAAWRRMRPGAYEYHAASAAISTLLDHGCERPAFSPIAGSGPNAVILHYRLNRRRMDGGELLLLDMGAECAGYTSDISRTIPVNGRFSPRQREIYEVVLGAQKAAIASVKPGMTFGKTTANSLYQIAYDYIEKHGGLGRYFTHGLSHHVGLEVHDANDPSSPLEEGMVITIEPGIYVPEENLGVRIEDVVLVTKNGAKVLSESLPREVADVEKAISQ